MASNSLELDSSQARDPFTANSQQVIDSSEIETKISRSTKPIALKMEVFAARTSGQSKRTIAKRLGIAENTVNAILREGKYDSLVAAGKFGLSTAIFDSVETIAKKCKTSERSAMYVLDKLVFAEESGGRTFSANMQVNVHIPRPDPKQFEQRQIASNSEVLEVQPAITTTNSGSAVKSKR